MRKRRKTIEGGSECEGREGRGSLAGQTDLLRWAARAEVKNTPSVSRGHSVNVRNSITA